MKPVEFPGVNVVLCKRPTGIFTIARNESTRRPARIDNNEMGIIPGRIEANTGNRDNSFIRTNV